MTEERVYKIIQNVKNRNVVGWDGIPTSAIKAAAPKQLT